MNKPVKLNLYQMWELYQLSHDRDIALTVPRSLHMLYPKKNFNELHIDEKIAWYFKGLDANLYFHFQSFITGLKEHGR